MYLSFFTVASCIVLVEASLRFCNSDRFEDAFLANVTNGLPSQLRQDFCDRSGTNAVLTPEDTGIVHYVLTGGIVTDQLGKQGNRFNILQLGQVAPLSAAQTSVTLHLWIRAWCNG